MCGGGCNECSDGDEVDVFLESFMPSSMVASFRSLNTTSAVLPVVVDVVGSGGVVRFSRHDFTALISSSTSSIDLSIDPYGCCNEWGKEEASLRCRRVDDWHKPMLWRFRSTKQNSDNSSKIQVLFCILYTPIWHFRKRRPIEFLPTTYDCNNPPQLTHFNVRHVNAFSTSTQPSLINNSNPLFRLPQWCCWWIPEEVLQALTLKSTPSARSI